MLGRMFGRCDAMLQPNPADGSIFIDRDGEMFGLILDFLSGDPPDGPRMQRTMRALPEAAQEALVQELDYFGLVTAVFGERPWTDDATFRPGPALGSGRVNCAAVLAGGCIVVIGGASGASALNTTELLDAQTMAFAAGPNLLEGRIGCAAVQIDEKRVLVVGGMGGPFSNALNTTYILHLSTRIFTPGPDMLTARNMCAAVALDARRILVVGGRDDYYYSTTEILNLDTCRMSFAPGPALASPRFGCAAVAPDEHRILGVGGRSNSGPSNTTEILCIRTMAFAPGPSMGSARWVCAAVPVDTQHVLIIGGKCSSYTPLSTTDLLDVAMMEFAPGPAMRTPRWGYAATRLDTAGERRFLVVGGYCSFGALSTTEVLAADVTTV